MSGIHCCAERRLAGARSEDDDRETRLAQLLEAFRPDLTRFAYWLSRDRSVAEDIAQETLLRAWRARDALKDPAALRSWLLTIARREHARLYERKQLELVSLNDCLDDVSLQSESAAKEAPEGELNGLREAILRLPIEYREPLLLQVIGGFSTTEIAHELGLTLTAVLTRLFRARNKLRALYGLSRASSAVRAEPEIHVPAQWARPLV
jgi:RNA polymerase sigma-70 factor (ECF subfamily)